MADEVPLAVEEVAEAIAVADCGFWAALGSEHRDRYLRMARAAIAAVDVDRLLLTLGQAAACVSVSRKTLERRIAAGELEAVRIGSSVRIVRGELERWVTAQQQGSLLGPRRLVRGRRRPSSAGSSSVSLVERLRSASG